jgi:succinyldiaminopimelate transaminase
MPPSGARLPEFPWDRLAPAAARAGRHPDGIVDLSVGTPVDPTPDVVRRALAAAADAPGYPLTTGSAELKEAVRRWLARRFGVDIPAGGVLPVIGSKELVASLPTLLGAASVGYPALAYPTYAVGAQLAGASGRVVEGLHALGPERVDLLWLNSPSNPTGRVLPVEHLRKVVSWARERDVVVASDECYSEMWFAGSPPVSVLAPQVHDGSLRGLLAVHSLSKRSNMAGYRAGFVAGDPELVQRLLDVRKHAGMLVPAPVQAAMVAALDDEAHVAQQRDRYGQRRAELARAFTDAGFRLDDSEAGLYLWATRDEPCWVTVDALADDGILVTPGEFYGAAGATHVRIALTVTDERVGAAVKRLAR